MKPTKNNPKRRRSTKQHSLTIKLVIDRSKRLRGSGTNNSQLFDGERMCCLGFLGIACGFTETELRDLLSPADLPAADDPFKNEMLERPGSGHWPKKISRAHAMKDSRLTRQLVVVNDANGLLAESDGRVFQVPSEKVREHLITKLMAQAGVAVTFVDGK